LVIQKWLTRQIKSVEVTIYKWNSIRSVTKRCYLFEKRMSQCWVTMGRMSRDTEAKICKEDVKWVTVHRWRGTYRFLRSDRRSPDGYRRDLRRRFLPTSFRMAFSRRAKRDAIFMLRWKFRAMRIIELGFSRR